MDHKIQDRIDIRKKRKEQDRKNKGKEGDKEECYLSLFQIFGQIQLDTHDVKRSEVR